MRQFHDGKTGVTLKYLEFSGAGRPLIMLHDLGRASSYDYPELSRYPALTGRSLILLDLAGFGYSAPAPDFGYTVTDHSRSVVQFARHKGYDRLDLFGHGFGGTVALDAAMLLGNRVKHLILAQSPLDADTYPLAADITRMEEPDFIAQSHASLPEEGATCLRHADPAALYRGAQSLVDGGAQDWRQMFYSHPAQKTYIIGETSLPYATADGLEDRGIRCLVVPKAGHDLASDNLRGLGRAISMALSPL